MVFPVAGDNRFELTQIGIFCAQLYGDVPCCAVLERLLRNTVAIGSKKEVPRMAIVINKSNITRNRMRHGKNKVDSTQSRRPHIPSSTLTHQTPVPFAHFSSTSILVATVSTSPAVVVVVLSSTRLSVIAIFWWSSRKSSLISFSCLICSWIPAS